MLPCPPRCFYRRPACLRQGSGGPPKRLARRREGRRLQLAILIAGCMVVSTPACGPQSEAGKRASIAQAAPKLVSAVFRPNEPGGSVIVVKDGKTVYREAIGMASLELGVPLQPDSVFRIGSVTKQFTSAAVMMLVEQGKVALQDDITKVFPDYPTHGKRITVEHLLTHTSGIKSYTGLPAWRSLWGRDFTTTELVDWFKNEPMDFDPGEKYLYNNSAYVILGALIEKVTGSTYAAFVAKNIFEPLGMTRTRYGNTGPVLEGRAQGYAHEGSVYINAPYVSMSQPGAAGGLVSTVDDLAKWDAAVSAGQLLTPSSWQRIFTPYRLKSGKSTGYGFGWQIGTFEGRPEYEHGGGIHGFSAYVVRLPEDHVYVAVLSNCSDTNTGNLGRKLAALAAGKPLADPLAVVLPAPALVEYAGVYQFDDVKVTVKAGDSLTIVPPPPSPVSQLVPMGKDRFFVHDSFSRFTFERDAAGKIVGVTRTTWGGVDEGIKVE